MWQAARVKQHCKGVRFGPDGLEKWRKRFAEAGLKLLVAGKINWKRHCELRAAELP
jgi:hypothetical protein